MTHCIIFLSKGLSLFLCIKSRSSDPYATMLYSVETASNGKSTSEFSRRMTRSNPPVKLDSSSENDSPAALRPAATKKSKKAKVQAAESSSAVDPVTPPQRALNTTRRRAPY